MGRAEPAVPLSLAAVNAGSEAEDRGAEDRVSEVHTSESRRGVRVERVRCASVR